MQKLLVITLLVILLFTGCSDAQEYSKYNSDIEILNERYSIIRSDVVEGVFFAEAECCNIAEMCGVDEIPISLDEETLEEIKPVKTKQEAVKTARNILEKHQQKKKAADDVVCEIVYFPKDTVWRFEYASEELIDGTVEGGSWFVAIDGNSGRLIKAWGEE